MEIAVLNHGYVKLIDKMGTDESVIDAARQSTNGSFVSWDPYEGHPRGDAGLLEYLYREQHATPFEMAELVLEVRAPIFVVREWHRHRTQSYNEASARYAPMEDLHYLPPPGRMQRQSRTHKQSSAGELLAPEAASFLRSEFESAQKRVFRDYQLALDYGLAREVARINTPVSRYTRFRAKANLRNWLGFLTLRLRPNAQDEIRVYAEAVAQIVAQLWPRSWALFEEYDRYGRRYSRTEIAKHVELVQERNRLRAALRNLLDAHANGAGLDASIDEALSALGDR